MKIPVSFFSSFSLFYGNEIESQGDRHGVRSLGNKNAFGVKIATKRTQECRGARAVMSWGTSRNLTSDEITSRPDLTSMNRIIGHAESRKCGKRTLGTF